MPKRLQPLSRYIYGPPPKKKRPSRASPLVKKLRVLKRQKERRAEKKEARVLKISILKDSNVRGVAGRSPRYASSRKSDARRYYREFLTKYGGEDLVKKRRRMAIRLIAIEEVLEGEGMGVFEPEVKASLGALV
jgi:L-lactate utilization protein LutB